MSGSDRDAPLDRDKAERTRLESELREVTARQERLGVALHGICRAVHKHTAVRQAVRAGAKKGGLAVSFLDGGDVRINYERAKQVERPAPEQSRGR